MGRYAPNLSANVQPTTGRYKKTAIVGAVADTAVKAAAGIVGRVVICTAGAVGSTVSVYDGAVSGTAFAVIDGTALGSYTFEAACDTSIHVKTVDSGGTLRTTVLWL
jgi:hypothetical protein